MLKSSSMGTMKLYGKFDVKRTVTSTAAAIECKTRITKYEPSLQLNTIDLFQLFVREKGDRIGSAAL